MLLFLFVPVPWSVLATAYSSLDSDFAIALEQYFDAEARVMTARWQPLANLCLFQQEIRTFFLHNKSFFNPSPERIHLPYPAGVFF